MKVAITISFLPRQVKPLLTGTRHGLPLRRKGRGPSFLISHQTSMWPGTHSAASIHCQAACSLGRIWLISHDLSANEQYFSLTPNQPTILSVMAYKPNEPKRTGREEVDPIKRTERSNLMLWTSPQFTLVGAIIIVLTLLIYTLVVPPK